MASAPDPEEDEAASGGRGQAVTWEPDSGCGEWTGVEGAVQQSTLLFPLQAVSSSEKELL